MLHSYSMLRNAVMRSMVTCSTALVYWSLPMPHWCDQLTQDINSALSNQLSHVVANPEHGYQHDMSTRPRELPR